jgi:hypothetical protein
MQNTFTAEARRALRTAEEYKTFSAVLRASAVNELGFRPRRRVAGAWSCTPP